ncbi:hypothetical protein M3765_12190 [Streptomyces thermoviolaceus]|uniref:hypothetical protein n=1 Tax=Streptomyces thermoviolaceus TaxID=1952 RepID=UPI00203C2DE7|nr:hypothetical protein [Streptomyces thermoviolaceus]MCM3264776.1 hypothetical protein [Streptomyces thermoviolaceus]
MTLVPGLWPAMEGAIVTGAERDQAFADWLLSAATDPQAARRQWWESSVATLSCGTLFSIVRLDGDLVHVAAGSAGRRDVAEYLRNALDGPVFGDRHQNRYFVMAPASMAGPRKRVRDRAMAVTVLGRQSYVVVPRPGARGGAARARRGTPR